MACEALMDKFTESAPRPQLHQPCTCKKRCNNCNIFLGFFILSLSLHFITLSCFLDLRSEVKREIALKKRESASAVSGSSQMSGYQTDDSQDDLLREPSPPEVRTDVSCDPSHCFHVYISRLGIACLLLKFILTCDSISCHIYNGLIALSRTLYA